MAKILLLGGSHGQMPAIHQAKKCGLYTILCDYLPDNPGRYIVDEFYPVSTTDKEKVLEVAREKDIDYILAYGSDPATLTAACVASKMGLRGNSIESVEMLSHKDLFRKFQKENGFKVPSFRVYSRLENIDKDEIEELLPAVIKPVDSSDTKGITLIENLSELENAMDTAFGFSRCGRIIIEEKIDGGGAKLHGDGFVQNGELKFCEFGDHMFTSVSAPLKPSCTLFSSRVNYKQVQRVKEVLKKLIRMSGYKNGPINVEARICSHGDIYIMEVGPRNGGNYVPHAVFHATGVNLVEALFNSMLGKRVNLSNPSRYTTILFTIHSNSEGIFDSFILSEYLQPFLMEKYLYIKPGDIVKPYSKPGSSLGTLIFRFENNKEAESYLEGIYDEIVGGIRFKKPG